MNRPAGDGAVAAVADTYFSAIKNRDVEKIRSVFAADAELSSMAGTMHGRDEIAAFYRDLVFPAEELEPRPGQFLISGDRLAVEIELRLNGNVSAVADVFTITDGLITRLGIYSGPNLSPGEPA